MNKEIRQNSPQAWWLAARPKTLTGAAVPVMMALSLAWSDATLERPFRWVPAALCLLFAFLMQIDANFVNDYFDFRKGTDDEHRLGPRRACAQGWVTPRAMRMAMGLTTAIACLTGLPLICYGGVEMILVGLCCVVFCFLYTTVLSYKGMGDVLVLVFFGLVPVMLTYYLQTGRVTSDVFVASVACGLVIDTLLVVNNYRDRDNDRRTGKNTLVVKIGEKATERLFLLLAVAACLLGLWLLKNGRAAAFLLPLFYLVLHIRTWRRMKRIRHGKALNLILGENARNMFLYGLLFSAGVLFGC